MKSWRSASIEDTARAGAEIAAMLPRSGWIALRGDLGAGKTTLVREIVRAAGGADDDVASPTFAIVHEYPLHNGRTIWHLDAYRLSEEVREWEQIGIPDLLCSDDIVLVEWPREGFARWAPPAATITIVAGADETRQITWDG